MDFSLRLTQVTMKVLVFLALLGAACKSKMMLMLMLFAPPVCVCADRASRRT